MSAVRRALIVEDDHSISRVVADLLGDEGFEVDQAFDGEDGNDLALKHDYDIIILDIMLPRRSGFKVAASVRAAGVGSPILMLTAKEGELDEAEGLDAGADDFLRKPFESVVLIARVNALLRRRDRERPAQLSAGGIVLDPMTHLVSKNGATVSLTPREFSLLEFLLRGAGSAVTKEDIVSTVWGSDFEGDRNIAEVYVGYLRRKLDSAGTASFIHTVRGVGYQISTSSA